MIPVRKRFGQHFLHDPGVLDRIVQVIDPRPGDRLVEIGPGRGALTERLLQRTDALDAVEIDRDLAALLREKFPERLTLHQADALKFDFAALSAARGGPLRVIGNLVTADGRLASPQDVAQVGIGSRMRMVFADVAQGLSLPQWTVDEGAPAAKVWRYPD